MNKTPPARVSRRRSDFTPAFIKFLSTFLALNAYHECVALLSQIWPMPSLR
jgi:hypothetical protein